MIWGSRRRTRSRWGRSGPMTRGMSALSRAVGLAWRRSLQLRVVALTLGLSLAVILALGFVLTSQITDRVLDVKVQRRHRGDRAGAHHRQRDRRRRGDPLAGQQPAAGPQHADRSQDRPGLGRGLAGAFDAVLMVPGDGPRAATTAGPVDAGARIRCATSSRPGRSAYQYATVHTDGFTGPALIIGTPTSSPVANLELYLIFPLNNEQAPSRWCAAPWPPAAWCCWCCWPAIALLVVAAGGAAGAVGVAHRRAVRRGASDRADAGARRGRHGAAGGVVQRHGREPVAADHPAGGVR